MRALSILALLAASPAAAAGGPSGGDDAVAIVRAVIAAEAAGYGNIPGDVVPCLIPTTAGSTFDGRRELRGRLAQTMARPGADPSLRRNYEDASSLYGWQKISAADPDRLVLPPPTELRSLADAVAAIVAGPVPPLAIRRIEVGWLTPPYRLCGRRHRPPTLSLSSPVIRGDLAFVGAEFDCVMCGHGMTYALRRTGTGWAIIAEVTHWES